MFVSVLCRCDAVEEFFEMCLRERKSADKCRQWFEAQQACHRQANQIRQVVAVK